MIQGVFGMHTFVQVFMAIWFGGVLFFAVIAALALLFLPRESHPTDSSRWLLIFVPAVMLVLGAGMVRFGCWLAREEAPFLANFLRTVLEAKDQDHRI